MKRVDIERECRPELLSNLRMRAAIDGYVKYSARIPSSSSTEPTNV